MLLPDDVLTVMDRLTGAGYTAYCVGGCVRDSLLQLHPKDYDITTSAKPGEMQQIFSDMRVVETGLAHGTLTVILNHTPYEVTTYRIDGEYTDHRHPDSVTFVDNVHADLARRDFTINAMAYSPKYGIVDDFGGREDLKCGIIRCVGCPEERFREDALRILRGLRFASRFSFEIEDATASAMLNMRQTLNMVAAERIREEFTKLICGKGRVQILRRYSDVVFAFLPELESMRGFLQKNPHHVYDVWEHTLHALSYAPDEEVLSLAVLFHDCGKPSCFTVTEKDGTATGHFYGHSTISADICKKAMERLRFGNSTLEDVTTLVCNHDLPLSCEKKVLRRRLNLLGEENLRRLITLQHCDRMGTGTVAMEESEKIKQQLECALDSLLQENPCFSLKSLAVSGSDLINSGMKPGPEIGKALNRLLQLVIDGECENDKEKLMEIVKNREN